MHGNNEGGCCHKISSTVSYKLCFYAAHTDTFQGTDDVSPRTSVRTVCCIFMINPHHTYDLNSHLNFNNNNNKEMVFLANSIISFETIKKINK